MPNLTINGHQFEVPEGLLSRYGVGYTLATEGEAHALQQVFTENLRNNFASKVKAKLNGSEELTPEDQQALQAEFDQYASKYEFGVRGAGGGPRQVRDPVEKEVRGYGRGRHQLSLSGYAWREAFQGLSEGNRRCPPGAWRRDGRGLVQGGPRPAEA
jgi:hypothetical protein